MSDDRCDAEPAARSAIATDVSPAVTRARRAGIVDLLLPGFALALCLAGGFGLFVFDSYTPRMALLLSAGVPGLLIVARAARVGDLAARMAVGLVGWLLVAALFSGEPLLALKGTVGRESSGLIVVLCFGVWGLGRSASQVAGRLALSALLIGLGLNALVGFAQVGFEVSTGPFALQFDRATGFTPNPVYFGALVATGAAVSASRIDWQLHYRLGAVAVFAAAVNLSGSRVALLAGLVGVAVAGLRCRRDHWTHVAAPALSYVLGIAVSMLITSQLSSGTTSTERVVSANGGGRLQAWHYGLEAVVERPVFGWGLGRFRAATQGRFSADFVRTSAFDDRTQAWFDAHNVVLGMAVALGVTGLIVVIAWVVVASRQLRGPLVPGLVVLGLVLLVQPAGLALVPLALLIVGLAADVPRVERRPALSRATLLLVLVGIALAAYLAISDLRLDRALEVGDSRPIASAAAAFPRDSVVADLVAQSWYLDVLLGEPAEDEFREWSERSISAEPDRPYYRSAYAFRLIELGDYDEARRQAEAAIDLQPWHVGAWLALRAIGERTEDTGLTASATGRLCAMLDLDETISHEMCPPDDEASPASTS